MRRIEDLLKDLGFNVESPMDAQKAFLRHLIRMAQETTHPPQQTEEQLEFDAQVLGTQKKKRPAR